MSAPTVPTISRTRRRTLSTFGGAALIALAVALVYWPALHGRFVLDDDKLVTDNDLIRSPDGLGQIWFSTQPQDYWPLTNSLFWLEWQAGGLNSNVYHLVSLVLHIAAALLIWRILRILAVPGAFLAALLFAVHPVNVQSVAWISQQKNLLAMVFFLLSILWYMPQGFGPWYWFSLMAFVLAMLSKGSVAVLPLLLLLIVWWQSRRAGINWHDLVRLAPFFVVAIVLTGVDIWFQTHGADVVVRDADTSQRLAGAGGAVWFYLSKALLPIDLVFIYPQWNIRTSDLLWWLPLLGFLTFTAVLWRCSNSPQARWVRPLLFAWTFFCVALLPELGFVDVGFMRFSLVADHYQHIALIAVAALAAAAWSVWHRHTRDLQFSSWTLAIAVVCALMALTWRQSALYAGPFSLYEATLHRNPGCWVAHNNFGEACLEAGRNHEAEWHFEEALRLNREYPDAYNNLGSALLKMGHLQEAIGRYEQALRLKPNYAEPYANLALTYAQLDRRTEAMEAGHKALDLARSQARVGMAQRIEAWLTTYSTEPSKSSNH